MDSKQKKIPLLILAVTSLFCSRTMFYFFDDPEGPNLLVVTGMAVIIYFLSLAIRVFHPLHLTSTKSKDVLLTIVIQIIITTGIYFCLN